MANPGRSSVFRTALRHRDFRLLLGGMAVSGAGDWLYVSALTAYVLDHTASPTWVAAVTILRFIPHLLFGPLGGVIADRYPRKTVMLVSDITRLVLMLGLALLAAAGAPVLALMAVAFLVTSASVPYFPSVAASTPVIVGEQDLAAANSTLRAVDHLTVAIGPAIGSILLIVGSESLAFTVNAFTFLGSAALVRRLKLEDVVPQAASEESMRSQMAAGWQAVTGAGGISVLLGPFAAVAFTVGTAFVLLPLVAEALLSSGSDGVGFLFAAVGAGGLAAAAATGRLGDASRPGMLLVAGVVVSGGSLMLLSQTDLPILAYLLMAAAGAGNIVLNVVAVTLLQRVLAREMIGRVFGILNSVAVASLALGSLLAPFLVERLGLKGALLVAGAVAPLVTLPISPRFKVLDDRAARRLRELAPHVDLLRDLPVFRGAPRTSLEALAAALSVEEVSKGTVLIQEGDAPDDFFVIVEGAFDVTSRGESGSRPVKVRTLGQGEHFGEIGLMTGLARTASVEAGEPSIVLRIPGDDFVAAIRSDAALSGSLAESALGRLSVTHPQKAVRLEEGSEAHLTSGTG